MYVKDVERVELSLTGRECVDLAIYIKRVIEHSAKEHYIGFYLKERPTTHSEDGFIEYLKEKGREVFYIESVKTLSAVGGSPQFYDDLIYRLKQIYKSGISTQTA